MPHLTRRGTCCLLVHRQPNFCMTLAWRRKQSQCWRQVPTLCLYLCWEFCLSRPLSLGLPPLILPNLHPNGTFLLDHSCYHFPFGKQPFPALLQQRLLVSRRWPRMLLQSFRHMVLVRTIWLWYICHLIHSLMHLKKTLTYANTSDRRSESLSLNLE
jgi:hypothetical protein